MRRSRLVAAAEGVAAVLESAPSTIRPHLTIDELAARLDGSPTRTLIVTDPEGRLLGVVRRDDVIRRTSDSR